jgi:hypothetical protein
MDQDWGRKIIWVHASTAEPPFVPVPDDVEGEPGPSTLWVRVSAEGKTLEVRRLRPSNDAAFERDARAFAMEMA